MSYSLSLGRVIEPLALNLPQTASGLSGLSCAGHRDAWMPSVVGDRTAIPSRPTGALFLGVVARHGGAVWFDRPAGVVHPRWGVALHVTPGACDLAADDDVGVRPRSSDI